MTSLRFQVCAAIALLFSPGCFDLGGSETDETDAATGMGLDDSGGPSCDPASFTPSCEEGRVIECTADGEVLSRNCGPRSLCQLGSDGADCVWPLGDACDSEYRQCADPGGIHACVDGQWEFEPCPAGGACSDAQCFGPEDVACDWPDAEPRCDGDALVQCLSHGFEVASACDDGEVCRTGEHRASCADADAVSCAPEVFVSSCDGDGVLTTCSVNGWTHAIDCPPGDRCFGGPLGASCYNENAPACDPSTAEASCDGDLAVQCSLFGYETEQVCERDQECRLDEVCLFGCQQSAACIPSDAPACEERLDLYCDRADLMLCFDGRGVVLNPDCACEVTEDGPQCAGA